MCSVLMTRQKCHESILCTWNTTFRAPGFANCYWTDYTTSSGLSGTKAYQVAVTLFSNAAVQGPGGIPSSAAMDFVRPFQPQPLPQVGILSDTLFIKSVMPFLHVHEDGLFAAASVTQARFARDGARARRRGAAARRRAAM